MVFYAISWSVWLQRNEVVFRGVNWDANQVWENSKLRVAVWAKAKWPHKNGSTIDTYRNPSLGAAITQLKQGRKANGWATPAPREMKFNVDEATKGSPGESGIGGVMRDEHGHIKIMFSKSIGVGDANLAEIIAIREAFILFIASKWGQTKSLIIERDSSNAVKWVNQPTKGPWRLQKWILHVERLKREVISWQINHTFGGNNQLADRLAKAGIQRVQDLINELD
ncbi:Uncharacterized protein TCM_021598 [Theobroma cacao]|uniref:RNase H type-1 domain-containing protein n=1 Tax=Theobroma cacao TaxID=3641 RepID=A0A061EQY5_THECC|nr:Uncharacterized protein TCM_021598 [Theobroma cacao]